MPHYVKSHGLGNDDIVIDPAKVPFSLTPESVRLIGDQSADLLRLVQRA